MSTLVPNRVPACSPSPPMYRARAARPGVAKVHSNCRPTRRPLGPSPKADRGLPRGRRAPRGLSRRSHRANCAKRSESAFGLDPARIICGAGSDDLLSLIARAYLSRGRRGDPFTTHGFLVYPINTLAAGAKPVDGGGEELHHRRRRHHRGRDAEDEDRLPRQSEQPDRHLRVLRRGQAPAPRASLPRPPRARCGLRRIRRAQRLRSLASNSWRRPRTSSCAAPSPRSTASRRVRLGWMYGPAHIVDVINRVRGPFNVTRAGDRRRHRGNRRHSTTSIVRANTIRAGSNLAERGNRQARPRP